MSLSRAALGLCLCLALTACVTPAAPTDTAAPPTPTALPSATPTARVSPMATAVPPTRTSPPTATLTPALPSPAVTRTPSQTAPTPTASPPAFTRNLLLATPYLAGDDVRALQQRLLTLGYTEIGEPDGVFGPQTDKAVRRYQSENDLLIDGIVGQVTWAALFAEPATASAAPSATGPGEATPAALTATPTSQAARPGKPTATATTSLIPLTPLRLPVNEAAEGVVVAWDMFYDAANARLWILSSDQLVAINPETRTLLERRLIQPWAGRLLVEGGRLWYTDVRAEPAPLSYWVNAINLATLETQSYLLGTGRAVADIPTYYSDRPELAFDGTRLWVAWNDDKQLQVYDLSRPEAPAAGTPVPLDMPALDLAFAGGRIWALSEAGLIAVEPATSAILLKMPPGGFRLVFDGVALWVTAPEVLAAIDPLTGQILQQHTRAAMEVLSFDGGQVWGYTHSPHGPAEQGYLWTRLPGAQKALAGWRVPEYVEIVAYDGVRVWVAPAGFVHCFVP